MNKFPSRVLPALPQNHFLNRRLENQRRRTNIPENIAVDPTGLFDPDFVRFCKWQDGRVWVDDCEAALDWLADKGVDRLFVRPVLWTSCILSWGWVLGIKSVEGRESPGWLYASVLRRRGSGLGC